MYVHQLSLLKLPTYRHFLFNLRIDCLRVFVLVYKVNNVLYCMSLPAFIVTSGDKSQLWVYLWYCLCYLLLFSYICGVVDIVLHINFHGHLC